MPASKSKKNKPFMLIAGPCAVESQKQITCTAQMLAQQNISFLRGGIYKMRTQPQSFQGWGEKALKWIKPLKKKYKLKFVSEITDLRQLDILTPVVDIFQVGARNMFNYELLKELGKVKLPVILKRGFSARIKEWLAAADYLVQGGSKQIILCERGIRTFETDTRNTLDFAGALIAQKLSGFPVIIDPSHGTGRVDLTTPLALAAVAGGLNGLMVEVHPSPKSALSDGPQSLNFTQFKQMIKTLRKKS